LNGLTLKKQFERAFQENAKGTLDYLSVGTFNEHVAQPQQNPFPNWVESMGLEQNESSWDSKLWVDMYGDGITRDLEPSVQDGGKYWKLFESCMRVFRSGVATCSNSSEACCVRGNGDPGSTWNAVYSLTLGTGTDNLLTIDTNEVKVLLAQGWKQVCQPVNDGSSRFCEWPGKQAPTAIDYASGPFLINTFLLPVTSPCYRCISNKSKRHFVSVHCTCLGFGVTESVIGYVSQTRSTEYPRSLRTCMNQDGVFSHSLDAPCSVHSARLIEHLGFVK